MLLHQDLLRQRYEVLALVARLRGDDDLAVAALHLAHGDLTIDLGNNGGVRRVASLEQLGDTGQTGGDVTTLGGCTRNLDKRLTGADGLSILDHDVATHGEVIGSYLLALGVEDIAGGHLGLVLRLSDDFLSKTGSLVGLGTEGDALDDVVELQRTGILGHDDSIEGVPLSNLVALRNDIAVLEVE